MPARTHQAGTPYVSVCVDVVVCSICVALHMQRGRVFHVKHLCGVTHATPTDCGAYGMIGTVDSVACEMAAGAYVRSTITQTGVPCDTTGKIMRVCAASYITNISYQNPITVCRRAPRPAGGVMKYVTHDTTRRVSRGTGG